MAPKDLETGLLVLEVVHSADTETTPYNVVGVTIAYTYKKSYRQLQDLLTPTSDEVNSQEHITSWANIITAKHISAEKGGRFIYDINNNSIDIEKVQMVKGPRTFQLEKEGTV